MSAFNKSVDKAGVVQYDFFLKFDKMFRGFHAENIAKQSQPKGLAFPLFLAAPRPVFGELCGCGPLLYVCHVRHPTKNDDAIIIR